MLPESQKEIGIQGMKKRT